MRDVMLDLETLGRRPGCAVLSIGAVMFDPATGKTGPEFYTVVSTADCVARGLHIDPETAAWWKKQGEDARQVLDGANGNLAPSAESASKAFAAWMAACGVEFKGRRVWGNGASFDHPILTELFRVAGVDRPWPFWGDMCYRTMKNMRPDIAMIRSGVQHNALDDARQQARHLMEILATIEPQPEPPTFLQQAKNFFSFRA